MKMRNIALAGIALFSASCTLINDYYRPRYRQPNPSSAVPFVCIQNIRMIPCVNASVNGRQGLFIVDTGATVTWIDTCFAKALGLKTRSDSSSWLVNTNVRGKLKVTWVDTLTVGNDIFEKFAVPVRDLTYISQSFGHQIDGVIGLNVLSAALGCQIDSPRGRFSLHPSRPEGHPVPIILENGNMFMNVRFNGRMIRMIVDTGANHTTLNPADFSLVATSGVSLISANIQKRDINDVTTNSAARLLRCECKAGDVIQKDFLVVESNNNLLGMDFFQHYIMTFDLKMDKAGNAYFEDRAANKTSEAIGAEAAPQPQR